MNNYLDKKHKGNPTGSSLSSCYTKDAFIPGSLDVYVNGVLQEENKDYVVHDNFQGYDFLYSIYKHNNPHSIQHRYTIAPIESKSQEILSSQKEQISKIVNNEWAIYSMALQSHRETLKFATEENMEYFAKFQEKKIQICKAKLELATHLRKRISEEI